MNLMKPLLRLLEIVFFGWLLGMMLSGLPVGAQNATIAFGSDSVSGAPVAIQTNGSGALSTLGK